MKKPERGGGVRTPNPPPPPTMATSLYINHHSLFVNPLLQRNQIMSIFCKDRQEQSQQIMWVNWIGVGRSLWPHYNEPTMHFVTSPFPLLIVLHFIVSFFASERDHIVWDTFSRIAYPFLLAQIECLKSNPEIFWLDVRTCCEINVVFFVIFLHLRLTSHVKLRGHLNNWRWQHCSVSL